MASVNKVILIGNLGKDPEVRYTQGGQAVANFNIACNDVWLDKSGQKQERTEWVRVVVWGKQAEHCGEYLSKGRQVYIEGRLQTREWTNKEGQKQYTTEVVAQQVTFLGSKGDGPARGAGRGATSPDEFGGGFGSPPPGFDEGPSSGGSSSGSGSSGGGSRGGGPIDEDIPF